MRRVAVLGIVLVAVPSLAYAHVSVRPRESKAGAEERYTVRVPTEGAVATTHVRLEIPADLTVLEVLPAEGATFETAKQGDRITSITWKKEIAPKQSAEFVFRARNPSTGEIAWKAHQHFTDGTTADWVGPAGDRRPASITKLTVVSTGGGAQADSADAAAIEALPGGQSAYATSEYSIKAKMGERQIDSTGLETLGLLKGSDGSWKIRHSHTSSRPARRPAA